jgi:bile-acid 7alpha-dehydratase
MMKDIEQLQHDIQRLNDIEAIKTLKHKYIRTMTLGLWDEFAPLVTDEIKSSYSDGKYSFENKQELLDFLKAAHAEDSPIVSTWMVGMPEIEFINDDSATAKWGFEHYSLIKPADMDLTMFAYYEDEYIKTDGQWRICKTGYQRVIEQEASRKDNPNLKLNVG